MMVSLERNHAFKESLRQQLLLKLEADLRLLTQAAIDAREAAVHEESKAEDKYDTRGLEASYLAGAQAKRAAELSDLITSYRMMSMESFNASTPVSATALVELSSGGKTSWLFVVPRGGGVTLELEGKKVQVITPVSTLGEEIVGRNLGDEFEVEIGGQVKEFKIVALC